MSAFSTFVGGGGGGKPARITTYTSGTGTFVPLSTSTSYARITIVGGGQGGFPGNGFFGGPPSPGGAGGAGGATVIFWQKLFQNETYAVGAGGGPNGNGGTTRFGRMTATGGSQFSFAFSFQATVGGRTGMVRHNFSNTQANEMALYGGGIPGGAGGGAFNTNTKGQAPNYPFAFDFQNGQSAGGGNTDDAYGGGGGGDSLYGVGGNGGNAGNESYSQPPSNGANGTGYGAGGGGGGGFWGGGPGGNGGSGSGGLIIIEEYTS